MNAFYCDACYNTGELDCYCGGDLCICDRHGTYDCPYCDGGRSLRDGEYPDEDASRAASIRNMSEGAFDRFAYGL